MSDPSTTNVRIEDESIKLGQFLKLADLVESGSEAKQLLAEAGYPQGFDLELWGASNKPVLEAITQQFNQVGVRTTLHYVKGPTLSKVRGEKKIAAEFSTSGSFSIPDAGAIVPDRLGPESDRDRSKDPELHKWVMAAVSTFDSEKRLEAFRKALQRTAEEAVP
jgi:peptide/nickel transport system substrate-binding protein